MEILRRNLDHNPDLDNDNDDMNLWFRVSSSWTVQNHGCFSPPHPSPQEILVRALTTRARTPYFDWMGSPWYDNGPELDRNDLYESLETVGPCAKSIWRGSIGLVSQKISFTAYSALTQQKFPEIQRVIHILFMTLLTFDFDLCVCFFVLSVL